MRVWRGKATFESRMAQKDRIWFQTWQSIGRVNIDVLSEDCKYSYYVISSNVAFALFVFIID